MDPATEARLQKRRSLLAHIENTPEFLAASAAARATRPEPADFTKRQWERAIGMWRLRLRASSTWSEGGVELAPPMFAAGPESGGSFYHLICMFSEADAHRVT